MSPQAGSMVRQTPGLSWWCLAVMYCPVLVGMILAAFVAAAEIDQGGKRAAGVWYAPSLAVTEPERKAE
ncbi:hypothetical protein [Fundidesulfovibrio putealis]|uniref:hypothetical protein n=1 Tax=Fundidesulfovibrio putealis TaxID=270496 RepID=UPI000481E355|nr:hypothetical protein [Fundidesulfovibrio putealis]KAF0234907.1 MAG: hypothetical protein FD177_470 [Desulfovibrionaceae bacterium]